MKLRSTPARYEGKDFEVFPAIHAPHQTDRVCYYYNIQVYKRYAYLKFDYFFVPEEIQDNLAQLYRQYWEWWANEADAWKVIRPVRSVSLPSFHDYVSVLVAREHAQWWIDLFETAAPLLRDPWKEWAQEAMGEKTGW